MARNGSALDGAVSESGVRPPIGFYFRLIREWIQDRTNHTWNRRAYCRLSWVLWPKLDMADTNLLLGMKRGNLKTMIGILTGHCPIGGMMGNWEIGSSGLCRMCEDNEEIETVEHILCHCPCLQRSRQKWLGSRFVDELDSLSEMDMSSLIGFVMGIGWLKECRWHTANEVGR